MAENNKDAYKWYRKAAEQGEAVAQCMVGTCYENGYGVTQDEAYKWYKKATEQGYAEAQYTIGTFYENGTWVEQDDEKALEWYSKAMD